MKDADTFPNQLFDFGPQTWPRLCPNSGLDLQLLADSGKLVFFFFLFE